MISFNAWFFVKLLCVCCIVMMTVVLMMQDKSKYSNAERARATHFALWLISITIALAIIVRMMMGSE